MAVSRSYTAGSFALEIEGQFAGWVATVEGGGAYADVVETHVANGATDKSISDVKYDDLTFTCGVPDGALSDWLTKFLKGQAPNHNGAIIFLDHNYQPIRRLEWDAACIVALTFPALDAAGKEAARLTIRIRPEVTRKTTGPSAATPVLKGNRSWQAGDFTVAIPGVSCATVTAVESLTITQTFLASSGRGAPKPGPLELGDLVLTVAESGAGDFVTWSDDFIVRGKNSSADEKSAVIRYLKVGLQTEHFSLRLQSVGIHRLEPNKLTVGAGVIPRLDASMYCEQAELVVPASTTPPPATKPPADDGRNDLRGFLGVRLGAEETTRRLRDTKDRPPITSDADRQRQLGVDLGIAWAERRASLAELEELGTVVDDWSSIALPPGHSLSEVLEATGVVPMPYDGRLELSRDSMVEGLLAGISKVMSDVSEEITANLK